MTLDLSCKVLECPDMEEARGFCALHLRRFIAGNVRQNETQDWVDFCAKGHPMMGDNVRWESSGKKGKKRRRCRACLRDKAQRQAKERIVEVEIPKPYRPNDLVLTTAIADFEEAQNHVQSKCRGDYEKYMDWSVEDDTVPTEQEAAEWCHGCPLLKLCGNYGVAAQMTHGIWGGRRVVNGVWI